MEQFPSNSKRSRPANKPVDRTSNDVQKAQKIVQGEVTVKKKSEFGKFISAFITDEWRDIPNFIVNDVVIPTIKRGMLESIAMTFGVDIGLKKSSYYKGGSGKVSYGRYYDDRYDQPYRDSRYKEERAPKREPKRVGYDYEDFYVTSKGEADDILETMALRMEDYGWCTVGDLYDMMGITPPPTARYYGWDDMTGMYSERTFDGKYRLLLPRPFSKNDRR